MNNLDDTLVMPPPLQGTPSYRLAVCSRGSRAAAGNVLNCRYTNVSRRAASRYVLPAAIALSLYVGLALIPGEPKTIVTPAPRIEETAIVLTVPPEVDDSSPEAQSGNAENINRLSPPQQVDVPGVVHLDSFLQPIQPPPPPLIASGALVIPSGVLNSSALAGAGSRIFDPASLDEVPVPRARMAPSYPPELRRSGLQGEVLVQFVVDARGDVSGIQIVESTHRGFEEAAINTVKRWKFKPGRKGGSAVATLMEQSIEFTLGG